MPAFVRVIAAEPMRRAYEQKTAAVVRWPAEDYPAIEAKPTARKPYADP